MSLEKYRRKRRFQETPEPKPIENRDSGGRRFCLQRHQASHLHYDLRLELAGVLKSWAVPKGPSLKPGEKRLAVATEDHPLAYLDWEGVIPAGQYGAGVMMVFDIGDWDPIEEGRDPQDALAAGELKFRLWGQKVQGDWTLVLTKDNNWLWIKKEDPWSDPDWDPDQLLWSAVSGRTCQEIASGLAAPAPRKRFPKGSLKAPLPLEVEPMLANLGSPFDHPDWLFEIKWDGVRALAYCQNQSLRVSSRAGNALTDSFPELRWLRARLAAQSFVIDGELVVLDEHGRPQFQKVLSRLKSRSSRAVHRLAKTARVVYYIFDLLYLDGHDLRQLPLYRRRELLEKVLRPDLWIRLSETVAESGQALYDLAVEQGLEGLMAKHRQSPYQGGRDSRWLKLKSRHTVDCVVVGFTSSEARPSSFGALQLARYSEGGLRLVAKVGAGFSAADLQTLSQFLRPLVVATAPLTVDEVVNEVVTWVDPRLVVEVEYAEITEAGALRHCVYLRTRPDLEPSDCRDDTSSIVAARDFRLIDGRTVSFSNPNKILFPELGLSKKDLADYYERVAPIMLGHLADRPLSLRRFPDGIHGAEFFQKHPGGGIPDWVTTVEIDQGVALVCDGVASLMAFSNLAAIELHVTLSRYLDMHSPDGILLDFDPHEIPFAEVKKVAATAGRLLRELAWTAWLKTSGGRGLHLFIPLAPDYSFEQSRLLAGVLCQILFKEHPKQVTLERVPAKRPPGTVYLDVPQNRYTATMAAAYSVRANEYAGVSTPLLFEELETDFEPRDFQLTNVLRRVERQGDPWSMRPIAQQRIETILPLLDERLNE